MSSKHQKKLPGKRQLQIIFGLVVMAVAIPAAIVLVQQNQDTRKQAVGFQLADLAAGGNCTEQCPDSGGVLRNCHPPEADGGSTDSICNSKGRVEPCGNKNYCCPSANGKWTTVMTACATPTKIPTKVPTKIPTAIPTKTPTPIPTIQASPTPSTVPVMTPTIIPTTAPTITSAPTSTVTVTVAPTQNPTEIPSPTAIIPPIKAGDLNHDGAVDNQDIALLLFAYLRPVSVLPEADLNQDGKINAIDYAIITQLIGT